MAKGPFVDSGAVVKSTLVAAGTLHDTLKDKIKNLPPQMGIALVDLGTAAPGNVTGRYAARDNNHKHEKHVYSLTKLAVMFTAFRLRERLNNEFAGATDLNDALVKSIHDSWGATVAKTTKGRMSGTDFPNVRKIFDLTSGKFEFKSSKWDWDKITKTITDAGGHLSKAQVNQIDFLERMRFMIRWSDNMAAGSIIRDMGFCYLFGVLTSEGLYSSSDHGFWVGSTFGYDSGPTRLGSEGSRSQDISQGATAFAAADLVCRIYSRSAVDKDSSEAMLDMMDESHGGTLTAFRRGPHTPPSSRSFDKIGLGSGSFVDTDTQTKLSSPAWVSDATIFEVPPTGGASRQLKYAAIGLESNWADMDRLIGILHDHMVSTR
jgi:hypothetical protein